MSKTHKEEEELPTVIIEQTVKPNGEIFLHHYIRGKFLGKGGYARVYEVISTESSKTYACKFIPKAKVIKNYAKQKLMSEIKIHRSLHHANIVEFFHFFEDENFIYILLEPCRNHSLNDLIRRRKRLVELEVQSYFFKLISALQYLHGLNVLHRDIKAANIFITDTMEPKLGDFGLATILEFEGERKRTICGTPNYIAPEILDGKSGHSYECDVWSLGVLLFTMLVGKPPFETKEVKTTYRRIKMNLYNYPENLFISKEAKNLISEILVVDYKSRISLSGILSHSFLTKNQIPKVLPKSTVAVPPSNSFLKRFEKDENETLVQRAASEETERKSRDLRSTSPLKIRPLSIEPILPQVNSKQKDMKRSSYLGNDPEGPRIWVSKWIDYSKKYGIGYILSNNNSGAYYNDNTKIINDPTGNFIQYISTNNIGEIVNNYTVDEFPQSIHKKVMILHLFKKQFLFEEKKDSEFERPLTHVKKWLATPFATFFRMSNKIIQICFRDSTELIFSSESKHVTYVDKRLNVNSYKLGEAIESGNKEMVKRIRYSKDIMMKMLMEKEKE